MGSAVEIPPCPFCGARAVPITISGEPTKFLCTGQPAHEWREEEAPAQESEPDRVEFYLASMLVELQAIRALLEAKQ